MLGAFCRIPYFHTIWNSAASMKSYMIIFHRLFEVCYNVYTQWLFRYLPTFIIVKFWLENKLASAEIEILAEAVNIGIGTCVNFDTLFLSSM